MSVKVLYGSLFALISIADDFYYGEFYNYDSHDADYSEQHMKNYFVLLLNYQSK